MVAWLANSQIICPTCATLYLKRGDLLSRVEELSPSFGHGDNALLLLMKSSSLGRLATIIHCVGFLVNPDTQRWPHPRKLILNKTLLNIFGELLKSIVYPAQDLQGNLIRLFGTKIFCEMAKDYPSLSQQVQELLHQGERNLVLGVLEVLPRLGWTHNEKLKLLNSIPDTDDPSIIEAFTVNLKTLGIKDRAELEKTTKYEDQTIQLVNSYNAEALKAIHKFIFRFIPNESRGAAKGSQLAFEMVAATYEKEDLERFYNALPEDTRKLVNLLLWRRAPLTSQEIERKLGLQVIRVNKNQGWRTESYVEPEPEYYGLLGLIRLDNNQTGVMIINWLADQFKRILPKPEKATLTGKEIPTSMPATDIIAFNPDFVALLPNMYQQLQQSTIPLKQNGTPTIAGYRTLAAYGGEYQEFFPNHKALRVMRSELLYRLFDDIEISAACEVTPQSIAKALLDQCFTPQLEPEFDDDYSYDTKYGDSSALLTMLTHLAWQYNAADPRLEKAYFASIQHLMSVVPKNKWVTIDDALDYLYFNNKGLGSPFIVDMAQVILQGRWSGKEYVRINSATVVHNWEEPLLKAFVLLLASISAVEVLCGEPVNTGVCAYNQKYLSRADGVLAFRLSPLGEWYFQGGDESCFKKLEQGRIVLDQKRLLLQLHGNDIALKAALTQTANRIGENFYSVDSASFLKECRTEAAVIQKINLFKALLPAELPQVWQNFFDTTLARLNPLQPVEAEYTILQLNDAPELKQLLLSNRKLRQLVTLAEGGLLLVSKKNMRAFKKALADLGFFVSGF